MPLPVEVQAPRLAGAIACETLTLTTGAAALVAFSGGSGDGSVSWLYALTIVTLVYGLPAYLAVGHRLVEQWRDGEGSLLPLTLLALVGAASLIAFVWVTLQWLISGLLRLSCGMRERVADAVVQRRMAEHPELDERRRVR